MKQIEDNLRLGEKGIWLSVFAYIILSVAKLWIGYRSDSEALSADGLNNATDIAASLAVLIGLRISRKPPDQDHRYGHYRAETVAALVASLIMFGVAIQVMIASIGKFREADLITPGPVAAWTSLACAAVMFGVYAYNKRLAVQTGSQAVSAAAQDNRSDALVSIGACLGIMGSLYGMPWLDPLTAVIVSVIIGKTAWTIFRDASHALTDGFDSEELQRMKKTVRDTPGVLTMIDLKARTHGNSVFVDVTVGVDGSMDVSESHRITERIEQRMQDVHRISSAHVHIEPYEEA